MTDWRAQLRDGDPVGDAALPAEVAAAIRRVVVTEAGSVRPSRQPWYRPLAVAAMVALVIISGVVAGRRAPAQPPGDVPHPAVSGPDSGDRRQLQFATPGGTRIIWTFDPAFDLKETNP